MKKWYLVPALVIVVLLIHACQKEKSFESGGIPSVGTLQSESTGDCLPKQVAGTYEVTTELDQTNYIEVTVDVTTAGQYVIYTDTINGFYFRGASTFTSTGLNTVRLTGHGTPFAAGTNNMIVQYGSSTCSIQVVTLPEGGGVPASFTLNGAPGTCTSATVAGTYTVGGTLNATNTVTLNVTVTTIGTYNISTVSTNGITFAGTGTFGTTGPTTVVLVASGTPVNTGVTSIAVPNTASCTFDVTVIGQATFTYDCTSVVVNGVYTENVPLDATNTITFNADVTGMGGYSITASVNGMTFSATGNFTATGAQPVTLGGSGTPNSDNDPDLVFGSCQTTITVEPGASIDWSFNQATTNFSGFFEDATIDTSTIPPPANVTVNILTYDGSNAAGDLFFMTLVDVSGSIQVNETYPTDGVGVANAAVFQYDNGVTRYDADPTMPSVRTIFKITALNTSARTFSGTFSGTAMENSTTPKPITGGTFAGTY